MTLFSKAAGRYFYVLNRRSSRRTTKSHKSRGGAHGRLLYVLYMYDYNTSDDNAIYIYIQIN